MSQKIKKKQRKLEKALTGVVKARTLNIAMQICKDRNLDFDNLDTLEKIKVVNSAKIQAEKDINLLMQHSNIF